MPRLAAALSITNTMNPHLFFFIIPIEAAHRRLPRRPPQLAGGVADTELEQEIRKDGLGRKKKEVRRKAAETRLATRKRRAAGTAPGISAQHAEVDQPTRTGQARVFFASAEPLFPLPSPSLLLIPSFPIPPRKIPNGKFRTPPNFSFLILFPSLAECRKHILAWAPPEPGVRVK